MLPKFLKHALRHHRLRRAGVLDNADMPLTRLGGWSLAMEAVDPRQPVYSFGVGDRIDWDLELIRRCGATVHAFDPTPGSVAWVARQQLPPQFVFHDLGISNFDGELDFHPPRRAGNTHYSQERRLKLFDPRPPVKGRVRRLATIMRELGHTRLGVLKLDVEGSEFDAIPDLIDSSIEVDQLLVEIHYHFRSRSFAHGLRLIQSLRAAGFECVFVSPRGLEFTFVRKGLAAKKREPLSAAVWKAA
jgi:FkbM family methyltransferase